MRIRINTKIKYFSLLILVLFLFSINSVHAQFNPGHPADQIDFTVPISQLIVNGSIGIGNTNPNSKLEILSSGSIGGIPGTLSNAYFTLTDGTNVGYFDPNEWHADQPIVINSLTQYIDFGTSNAQRMRIDASGNVGIGTTSPGAKLHVNGDIKAQGKIFPKGEGTGEYVINGMDAGTGDYGLAFYTGYANRLYIQNGGNVGIGTTNPKTSLHIPAQGIQIGDSATALDNFHLASDTQGGSRGYRLYGGNYGSGTHMLTVLTNGNVGIGTTIPGQKLDVAGTIKGTQLCIGSDCRTSWWPATSCTRRTIQSSGFGTHDKTVICNTGEFATGGGAFCAGGGGLLSMSYPTGSDRWRSVCVSSSSPIHYAVCCNFA